MKLGLWEIYETYYKKDLQNRKIFIEMIAMNDQSNLYASIRSHWRITSNFKDNISISKPFTFLLSLNAWSVMKIASINHHWMFSNAISKGQE